MEIDIQKILFEFIGGLGIFLLGIKYMGDGLQKTAGDRLRGILDRFTSNPIIGVFAGIIVTILIQSSSGTTVLTVGLVNAGFMTLRQAIGVIMGANIGTTVTAFIIGLNISEYSLPILAIGSFLMFFFKHQKVHAIGQTIFGFGSLFFGLRLMSGGMAPLGDSEFFYDLTLRMSESPILGVLVGALFTVIVQSSSATIGILQGIFSEGAITLEAALPVLLGDNLGTTITAVLAAIGSSIAAKRAAFTHVIFNLIGVTVFIFSLKLYTLLTSFLQDAFLLNPEMTIAFAHGTFNITNTVIQLPFVATLAWVVTKLIPGEDTIIEYTPKHLDPLVITQSSSLALQQAKLEIIRMGEYAHRGLKETKDFLMSEEQVHAEIALQIEGALNNLDKEITNYLVDISSGTMSELESAKHTALMDSVRDIERIGDHFENIVELTEYKIMNKFSITDDAMNELDNMFELVLSTFQRAINALENMDRDEALSVIKYENEIDFLERKYRKNHISRMNKGLCDSSSGVVFVDMISNLERIGDHVVNIAEEVIGEKI